MSQKQRIMFDDSALQSSLDYLRNPSEAKLEKTASARGNKLALKHHRWASMNSKMSGTEFWKKQLARFRWSQRLEDTILAVKNYLVDQNGKTWLTEVLRYLPEGHRFDTTVYLIVGYDSIVFREDVALNLNHPHFHVDRRESMYYLIMNWLTQVISDITACPNFVRCAQTATFSK